MSMPGGTGNTSGRYLIRGDYYDEHLTERQLTNTVTIVWGSVGLVFGLLIGMGLSSLFGLSTVFRVVLITALVLVVGGGTAWIARRIARRGTEDKRVAEFLAEYGSAESDSADSADSADSDTQRDAER
ncbi:MULTISPECIES: hypothetical protein [Streptomyces violaceusniger group]|uniref:DUF202 domain-containing protein n=2 Tax=Streptomyces rhizosphaericus TaxID=114699 RepID=A0ABP4BPR1_9ACTN|nr:MULTISPECIES: hypothetical protein [Streptomyces violaceusniger group]